LTEGHDFLIGFADGIKIGAAFGTAHGKTGQTVLEGLFETQELTNGFVDAGGETDAAFVRSDGRVELNTHRSGDLNLAEVIGPSDAELDGPLGFDDSFHDGILFDIGFFIDQTIHRSEKLFDRLKEFRLITVAFGNCCEYFLQVRTGKQFFSPLS